MERARQELHDLLWRSAMRIDRWFGSTADEGLYQQAFGSISPALLWDRHYGLTTPVRFNLHLPLPRLNERFYAFAGRYDPDEYITESQEPSGAFPRQYGPVTQDQTLLGLLLQQPARELGGHFDAGAGMRAALPLDPFVRGSYLSVNRIGEHTLVTLRQTLFWQRAQGFGVTSRADVAQIGPSGWIARWTGSTTLSQHSQGVTAWAALDVMRGFATRRALAAELEIDGHTNAPVPLHSYGAKLAYRQSVLRTWLVMELRTSLAWPRDTVQQERRPSPGIGLGLEMLIGTDQFLMRPMTF